MGGRGDRASRLVVAGLGGVGHAAGATRIPARTPGTADMPAIEPAPGRYVRVSA